MMTLAERIEVLSHLADHLQGEDAQLEAIVQRTHVHNRWFIPENIRLSMSAIIDNFLNKKKLQQWTKDYDFPAQPNTVKVGLILAGNIPLVGFHDFLCVFIAGHKAKVKLSDKDKYLLPYFVKMMAQFDSRVNAKVEFVERLNDFDAVIATGSDNSARYFEAYFGKYPNIIRKNRNGVAVLNGKENEEQLLALGKDVFQYFGLGCRNVAKLYVPQGYSFDPVLEALHHYRELSKHNKYKNNFDYNFTLLILNKVEHKANGCIMLLEDESLQSRIAQLHYEYYDSAQDVQAKLRAKEDEIQCIVTAMDLGDIARFPLGEAQAPSLSDYADGVDTLSFLLDLGVAKVD